MAASGRRKDEREGQAGYCESGEETLGATGVRAEVEVGLRSGRGGRKV